MERIFNYSRFGKYFMYDLNNAKNNYGLSLLILGLLPVTLFVFSVLFGILFGSGEIALSTASKVSVYAVAMCSIVISSPTKLYGHLTEKRAGSDWLMIPASSFEKFLSMMIIVCLVLPLGFHALFLGSDWLLSLVFPSYGDPVMLNGVKWISESMNSSDYMDITAAGKSVFLLEFCAGILPFVLGALWFKRSKPAKTILALMAVGMVVSSLTVFFFTHTSIDFDALFENLSAQSLQTWLNILVNVYFLVVIGGLMTAIFFRIKTLKH